MLFISNGIDGTNETKTDFDEKVNLDCFIGSYFLRTLLVVEIVR